MMLLYDGSLQLVLLLTLSTVSAFTIPSSHGVLYFNTKETFLSTSAVTSPFGLDDGVIISSPLIVSHAVAEASNSVPILPVLGSLVIMLTIISLLFFWEKSVKWIRETVPPALLPVVESILAEIGGLGFIGLILQTVGGAMPLEGISIELFGEGDILIETFEFLHTVFFQVGVGFFAAAGAMVAVGIQKLGEIENIEELQVDSSGACTVTPTKLADYLPILSDPDALPTENLWKEIIMPTNERAGKTLLMRNRLMEQHDLPNTFRIEKYVQGVFAENLLEFVELSPLTWIYLIPALALANSVDLSHEVINASSPNAAESVGFFFSTPWAIWPSVFSVALSLVWGLWNCWKLTKIKYMLLPRLGTTPETGATTILPPPVDIDHLRGIFVSSPAWVQPIEAIWAEPAKTNYEQLFGTAGAAGPELYRNSVQLQTWLCITQIVFFGTQIVPRDLSAILSGTTEVGDPSHLTAEAITYGSFVFLSLIQLVLVSPRSFWNLCLVSCVEDEVSEELLEKSVSY